MDTMARLGMALVVSVWAVGCAVEATEPTLASVETSARLAELQAQWTGAETVELSEEEWRELLTPEQFRILRQKGTERAFTGEYWDHKGEGVYRCAACGQPLFDSATKFKSGTGWPSFWQPIDDGKVDSETDLSFGMRRTEVLCSRCGGHLGHVFEDGPKPTGLRYCINSVSLDFAAAE